ncbi:glycosyltransferase family 2 protein [Paraglaciecola aquimarina]|uniref:Glycosyltransferase family 2 protein n=1 Tax=Paraglaciecola algarum TaxID=3050085 RepID=A0ABS9D670_9ALTE|nr:glycosyltransferase family 2 protein [Paraglaciecola sp. G1-23]MCF2948184.1 glycosyltransferase family 2 protein [Paraglaciecola sp. G1-23]
MKIEKPRILLAGIAKNEAAYLPEWIYHHLNIGIDSVLVYVNNTDDNSVSLLNKLGDTLPVKYKVVDGIENDQREELLSRINKDFLNYTPLQSKSYADIYIATSADEFDYILYLDIDEFLLLDQDLLALAENGMFEHSVISFQWFATSGDKLPFSCLHADMMGEFDKFTKYMIRTGQEDAKFHSCHIGRMKDDRVHFHSEGIVLHRVVRSKEEYLALIARSNPTVNNLSNGFKLNRRGWTSKGSDCIPSIYRKQLDDYQGKFEQFCSNTNIEAELKIAQENVSRRAKAVTELISALNQQNSELGKVLAGTGISHFSFKRWLRAEIKNRIVRLLFPSLVLSHVPLLAFIKIKLGVEKNNKFFD